MRARSGQVAVYLAMVLVAVAILMFVNVNVFLAVRAKNRAMNAVDAAALAAAKCQGGLLNELGRMNVRHLRALIVPGSAEWTDEDEMRMRDLAMFGPLRAIAESNRAAADWGFPGGEASAAADCLRDHVNEIASDYCGNPDLYPEYRRGQWADYAAELGNAIAGGVATVPAYMETANAWSQEPLLSWAFYDAIAARAWCWFGMGGRERYFDCDSTTMARPEFARVAVHENSEVYSLHVTFRSWQDAPWQGVFDESWVKFVCQVAGCTPEQLENAPRVKDPDQLWAFYDGYWSPWSRTFNPDEFPIAGAVKPEYDVGGCSASCLMLGNVPRLLDEDDVDGRQMTVTAEAKPFGTVIGLDGGTAPVTAYKSFIAPSEPSGRIFTEAQLVLVGSVPHAAGIGLDPSWYAHVKEHLPRYFESGPSDNGCYFCRQLVQWEKPEFRAAARDWLDRNRSSCTVQGGGGCCGKGGYDYAH